MSNRRAFWLGLGISLAVLLPFYFLVAAFSLSRVSPTDNPKSGVPILQPTLDDRKTLLVMTGEQQPEHFVLLRFDAMENLIACVEVPGETVVLSGGNPQTLLQAVEQAGPAQAAATLRETLSITIDDYIYCKAQELAEMAEPLGTTQLSLSQYLSADALNALHLNVEGVQQTTITTDMMMQALQTEPQTWMSGHVMRAQAYVAFLRAGTGELAEVLPDAMRKAVGSYSTNLTAMEIYDYERILQFLQTKDPSFAACVLPGQLNSERYELNEDALAVAREYLGSAAKELGAGEDEDGVTLPENAVTAPIENVPVEQTPTQQITVDDNEPDLSISTPQSGEKTASSDMPEREAEQSLAMQTTEQ